MHFFFCSLPCTCCWHQDCHSNSLQRDIRHQHAAKGPDSHDFCLSQAEYDLRQCGEMLDAEQAADDGARDRHRDDEWARPLSRIAAASYRENIARYESNLQAAAESDAANAARLAEATPRLQKLSVEGVRARMPRLERPMVAPGDDADTVVANLRQILSQLEQLSQERGVLEEQIRAKRTSDDVLPDLLRAGADGADRVFDAHLQARCHQSCSALLRKVMGELRRNAICVQVVGVSLLEL